ncbi:hypothetical protein GIB67_031264 [Kingdonia uniflora]|uniref:SAM domain-containing protein n=1 Tax=Kingdonia uniflora TaxID=39325 RepID=A0A7J7LQG2_9MAGN|nr:hypothetical protein GIB67_031264 [Kingdonia uniflora]
MVNSGTTNHLLSMPMVRVAVGDEDSCSTHNFDILKKDLSKRVVGRRDITIASLLHALGLGEYEINFRDQEVDMTELKHMGDNDLKTLGIPMGPRKRILLAVLPRRRRQLH